MKRTRAAVAMVFLLLGVTVLRGGAAAAGPSAGGDASEAWYATTPLLPCTSPVGCPPVAAPPPLIFPADTLHVGVAAGSEVARTYVAPDLSVFPSGGLPPEGVMTLPLSSDPRAGASNVPGATVIACLVVSPFADGVQGSSSEPPATDCTTNAPATYRRDQQAFIVQLAPFLAAWQQGRPALGIALLPATGEAPTASWRVAFNGRRLNGVPHVTSAFADAAGRSPASVPSSVGAGGEPGLPASQNALGTTLTGPSANAPLAVTALESPDARQPLGVPSGRTGNVVFTRIPGFQYSQILLLPIALLLGGVWLAQLLTSDATPGVRR